jgi:hypothetical protein
VSALVRTLSSGPLDIVGDVHGEIEALRVLLERLGYDPDGVHSDGRRLVFVGDLCDRGPDSPAVVELAMQLVERGRAQCILGNHELNLLRGAHKHGNHWFFGDQDPQHEQDFGPCVLATKAQADRFARFFAELPVVLEREDLRVVHAAWDEEAIAGWRTGSGAALDEYHALERNAHESAIGRDLRAHAAEEAGLSDALKDPTNRPQSFARLAAYEEYGQMSNPLKVVTSGFERVTARPFFAAGRWRFVERVPWWREYRSEVPVVFGHYWRWWNPASQAALSKGEPDLFASDAPLAWQRNAAAAEVGICIDYSAGARFKERLKGKRRGFAGRLAALRWPERELVFDEQV